MSQAAKKGAYRLQQDKVHVPAGLINQVLFCIFTVGLVQITITLLFFGLCVEALQHWRIVSSDLDRDPGDCKFQMIT